MIPLPIAHDRFQLRRFPAATVGLVLTCLAAFLLTTRDLERAESELDGALANAQAFVEVHPYLDPSAAERDLPRACRGRLERLERGEGEAAYVRDAEAQAELDRLCGALATAWTAHPFRRWGLIAAEPRLHSWISYAFVHAGWMHLTGNLLLLFLTGLCLEELWGRTLFLGLYQSAGLASALWFTALYPELQAPLIGASGAVAALMGAFLVRCWDTRFSFLYAYWLGRLEWGRICVPAWALLPLWFVYEAASALGAQAWAPGEHGGQVAHWVHVAGFAYGMGCALIVQASGLEPRVLAPRLEERTLVHRDTALERAAAAERAGEPERAFELLRSALTGRAPGRGAALTRWRDQALAFWTLGVTTGRADEAAPVLCDAIARWVAEGDWEAALAELAELVKHVPDARPAVGALVGLASGLLGCRRTQDARFVLEIALTLPERAPFPPERALDLARSASALDRSLALRTAELALTQPACDPAIRSELEALRAELDPSQSGPPDSALWNDVAETRARAGEHRTALLRDEDAPAPGDSFETGSEPAAEADPSALFDRSGRPLD